MAGLHRRRKRTTTTDDYAAMLRRMLAAYGRRIGEEPAAGLAHLRELESALTDATNLGIYTANQAGTSYNQIADALGISKAAAIKRAKLGEQIAITRGKMHPAAALATRKVVPRQLTAGSPEVTPGITPTSGPGT
jgi:hypothetical protein